MLDKDPAKRPSFKKILENDIFEGYLDNLEEVQTPKKSPQNLK
jgi:hypothetical protein